MYLYIFRVFYICSNILRRTWVARYVFPLRTYASLVESWSEPFPALACRFHRGMPFVHACPQGAPLALYEGGWEANHAAIVRFFLEDKQC